MQRSCRRLLKKECVYVSLFITFPTSPQASSVNYSIFDQNNPFYGQSECNFICWKFWRLKFRVRKANNSSWSWNKTARNSIKNIFTLTTKKEMLLLLLKIVNCIYTVLFLCVRNDLNAVYLWRWLFFYSFSDVIIFVWGWRQMKTLPIHGNERKCIVVSYEANFPEDENWMSR